MKMKLGYFTFIFAVIILTSSCICLKKMTNSCDELKFSPRTEQEQGQNNEDKQRLRLTFNLNYVGEQLIYVEPIYKYKDDQTAAVGVYGRLDTIEMKFLFRIQNSNLKVEKEKVIGFDPLCEPSLQGEFLYLPIIQTKNPKLTSYVKLPAIPRRGNRLYTDLILEQTKKECEKMHSVIYHAQIPPRVCDTDFVR